jgi:uncharacterized membrane protein
MNSYLSPRPLSTQDKLLLGLSRYWILIFGLTYGLFVGLPFLAPVFMQLGLDLPGRGLYWFYSFFCHQLPERSFFLFGAQPMYSLAQIQAVWQNTFDPMTLRQYIGGPQMGWKVAWSDRMISMYTSIWFFGLLWWPLRKWLRPLPFWGLVLLALPMMVDGTSHMISDLAGIGQGFRDSNAWLAELTGNAYPAGFYAGDQLGSFNSWMRLITGTLFGLGFVWFGFPYVQEWFAQVRELIRSRQQAREQILRQALAAAQGNEQPTQTSPGRGG